MNAKRIDAGRRGPAQRGLSLIELLVAVALGGILMGGAITLFVNNRATYEVTNDMARLQENARFALETMVRDIRMAGYVGCVNDITKVNNNPGFTGGQLYDPTHGIEGYESDAGTGAWSPSGHTGESGAVIAGGAGFNAFRADSDGITVRYLSGNRADGDADGTPDLEMTGSASEAAPTLTVENLTLALNQNQAAAISDCGGADLFQVASPPGANTVVASGLSRAYDPINRALLSQFVAVRYFVRDNEVGVPALFRSTLSTNAFSEVTTELVDGVQSLQIVYGVDDDQDGIADSYLSADEAGLQTRNDWLSVVSVKIGLLLATIDEFGEVQDTAVYDVAGTRICPTGVVANPGCDAFFPPDRRRRRVFQTTVTVRNFQ